MVSRNIFNRYMLMNKGRNSAAIRLQHKAAEKYNLKCRLKEEEVLVLQEMASFLHFFRNQIESLEQEITGMCIYCYFLTCMCTCININIQHVEVKVKTL